MQSLSGTTHSAVEHFRTRIPLRGTLLSALVAVYAVRCLHALEAC